MSSCLTNKYAEGYPDVERTGNRGRYYGGCYAVDELEQYCCNQWQKVFNTDYHVNVQPHSGANANLAAYLAVLQPGDTVLSMSLENGGHLTHGSKVNITGQLYNFVHYGVDNIGYINYNDISNKIVEYQPKLIVAGASAYSREIDFNRIADHIDRATKLVNRYSNMDYQKPLFMVDMAHIAGLIASGCHSNPFGIADIITTTTHKTLRGPRGGLIFCKPELAKKIDKAVFPGLQGGPLEHIIAAKAVCAEEAQTSEYCEYIHQVVSNCKAMAEQFKKLGYNLVTNGTDNHLLLLDFTNKSYSGKDVQNLLDEYGITLNKNCIPNETRSPSETSGVRIGTAAMTTKGWKEEDFINCANEIDSLIKIHLENK